MIRTSVSLAIGLLPLFAGATAAEPAQGAARGTVFPELESRSLHSNPAQDCQLVLTSSPESATPGERFWVDIVVGAGEAGPVDDLFGVSGRLRFSRSDILEALEVSCTDSDGSPLDLGSDVICMGRIDPGTSFADFVVTRKADADGVSGELRVVRIALAFTESAPAGECSHFTVSDLHAVDSNGERICLQAFETTSRTCVRNSCTVWPGDANNDGSVDEADVFTVASFWGEQGPARTLTGCPREGIETMCWSTEGAVYSDAYGDGRVGAEDVLCIGVNWGSDDVQTLGPVVQAPSRDPALLRAAYREMYAYLQSVPDDGGGIAAVKRALEQRLHEFPTPSASFVEQNVPNPFNPRTVIQLHVATRGRVQLTVLDVLGRRIKVLVDGELDVGVHPVEWDGTDAEGRDVPSGVYVYQATLGGERSTHKMVLTR